MLIIFPILRTPKIMMTKLPSRQHQTHTMHRIAIARRILFSPPSSIVAYRHRPFFSMSIPVSSSSSPKPKPTLNGVVFDMDGTLTVPVIDFPAMYREVLGDDTYFTMKKEGGGAVDILHCIERWDPAEQKKAYEVITRFEKEGMDKLKIMPGAAELCAYLDSRKIRRGLITRNVKDAVDLFHQRFGMEFCPALSREFRPYKPDPAPLLHICAAWNLPPDQVLMVGDSLRDDVVCGKRAGALTCLLDETGRYGSIDSLSDDTKPDFKVSALADIQPMLLANFDLKPTQ